MATEKISGKRERTPGPWALGHQQAVKNQQPEMLYVYPGDAPAGPKDAIFQICWQGMHPAPCVSETDKANAAFIVKACNSHELLVAALEAVSRATPIDWKDGQAQASRVNACEMEKLRAILAEVSK